MEAGFKRIWSRKKSLSAADQPTGSRKVSAGHSVLSQSTASTARDGRPSMASTHPQQGLNAGSDVAAEPNGTKFVTSTDELSRTKSGHRIQPMLVGISRPPTGKDRPDTAGSFQLAVQKAADSVNRRPSEVSPAQPIPVKQPLNTKPSIRHVDIFSVAASAPSYLSRYNEEVAERNLDTYRLELENTPYVYDPSSKYQEEVAVRNAYLPYRSRTSTDARRSQDHDRTTSLTSKSIRGVMAPQPNGVHSYHSSVVSADLNQRILQDQRASSRQSNPRSPDGAHVTQLSRVQPEEPDHARVPLKITTQNHGPQSPQRISGQSSLARENRMSTIAEGQLYVGRPSTDVSIRGYHAHTSSGVSDYQISESEYRVTSSRLAPGETTLAIPPARGSASASKRTIVLPNRTIMDLTGDDTELVSETSSAFGYSQYSPVIEQAKSDAFKMIKPSQIHTEERRVSKGPSQLQTPTDFLHPQFGSRLGTVPLTTTIQGIPTPTNDQTERGSIPRADPGVRPPVKTEPDIQPELEVKSKRVIEPVRDPPPVLTEIHPAFKTLPPSTFSPISTTLSWSPRSSAYVANPPDPISMTARVAAALEASKAAAGEASSSMNGKKGVETPTVKERVASYESTTEQSTLSQSPTPESSQSAVQVPPPVPTITARPAQILVGNDRLQDKAMSAATKAASIPTVYASPESITSVDYTNPGSTFGVRTRDFALVPQENTPAPQKERNIKPTQPPPQITLGVNQKSRSTGKTRSKRSTPSVAKPKEPGFDEDAFARKQAEARAALEKLQKSLNEDFMTLPERPSARKSKGKEPERVQSQSTAPAVLPPQTSKSTAPVGVSQKPDGERPPPSSFRNSRGEQQRSSLISTRSLSSSSKSSRRAPAPSTLKNVEAATRPIDQTMVPPALLQAVHLTSKAPRSPGEISLSSFPVPSSSRPPSQPDVPAGYHSHTNSYTSAVRRRNSQSSTASAFSIPLHMVPGRSSSVRDPLPEEGDPLWL